MAYQPARAYAAASGDLSCPCLNVSAFLALAQTANNYATIGGEMYSAFEASSRAAPPFYGQSCRAHDVNLSPYCEPVWCGPPINGECVPRWCSESWCWVDANACMGVVPPTASSYFAHVGLTFSYETCNMTNVFSSFYAAIMAPKPPPPLAPPPPTAPPPYLYEAEIGFGSTAAVLVLIALLFLIQNRFLTKSLHVKQRKAAAREAIRAAIDTTGRMRYTASFVRAQDFLELGHLVPHEELRNRGKLVYRDSFNELAHGQDYTIFISHQWTSYQLPDPSGEQYIVMCAAVRKIAEEKLPPATEGDRTEALTSLLSRIFIWVE